jgi:hypothetical protein
MSQLISRAYSLNDKELAEYPLPELKQLDAEPYPPVSSKVTDATPNSCPFDWLETAEIFRIDDYFLPMNNSNTYTLITNYYKQTAVYHSIKLLDLSTCPRLNFTFKLKLSRLTTYLENVQNTIFTRMPDDWKFRETLTNRWVK